MSSLNFFQPSRKMKEQKEIGRDSPLWAEIHELFANCPVGMSFAVNSSYNVSTVRNVISRKAKMAGKKFSVIKHDDCYEISRIE